MSTQSAGEAASKGKKAATLQEITEIAIKRQEAWARAHELSMELHEAIESSGYSPTRIAANAPISRVAIYSLKRQMEARLQREKDAGQGSGGKN